MRSPRWMVPLALLGCVGVASAQWREGGRIVADTTWRKDWGSFGAMLQLTDRPDELFADWNRPGAGVPVSTTDHAKRGAPIVAVVIFTGCSVDVAGLCDSSVYFQVFKPDGSPYVAEQKSELWSGKPAPASNEVQLGVGAMGVRIEPKDPSGTYVVRARLVDNLSHAEVELSRTFLVSP